MNYRAEIDGLRAVAVLAVVLYHAGATPLSGGFVGVDIFFVISGYLISRIILADLAKNTFSLKQFYFRRIKRIFPAYLLVLLSVTLFGSFFSFPYQYLDYGKELSVASTFVSNFYYMFQQGYFEKQSADHLLLHTWSLSVEEQFYIFFPLLLMVLSHKKIYVQQIAIVIIALISFAACVHLSSFYNPVTRFWEFLIGTGVAFLDVRQLRSIVLRNLMAILGFSMVFYGYLCHF